MKTTPPMFGEGQINGNLLFRSKLDEKMYSPVTLNDEWPKLGRLLFVLFCSSVGTTMNGFFVSSFFVEDTLRRLGNVFLACIGMADLIITTLVLPTVAVVLLSGEWNTLSVCKTLQFLTITSTYCYSIFFTMVALETYFRLCCTSTVYGTLEPLHVSIAALFAFVLCLVLAAVGVFFNYDYDYCLRTKESNIYFRILTNVFLHIVPGITIMYCLIASSFRIRRRAREQAHYKRSQQYERDYSTVNLNLVAYSVFAIAWIPSLILVYEYPEVNDKKFYKCVWCAVTRSVITSFIYATMNRSFRRAFAHLFNYCCCKSSLTGSFASRHRRALEYKGATGDVRVHIMHQAINSSNPQRTASSSCDTQEL